MRSYVQLDTLLTEREVRAFLARRNATMDEIKDKFRSRFKQNPQNKALLPEILKRVAIEVKDEKHGVKYAARK